ncbi:caspase family protein [Stieleria varia]|uniref:Caspase domain protein n=2 Tax=Stieleria varia TaxID=2528005 RepID=A0A5C5ZQJ1_9BACT|nr:Caspase domain protein [Stieleria varia]
MTTWKRSFSVGKSPCNRPALGTDFRKHIERAVSQCDVLLVVIGDKWLSICDDHGRQRLFDEKDMVRLEIETALKRDIKVIPVLVGCKETPKVDEVPPSLSDLTFRNAVVVVAGETFRAQLDRLIEGIQGLSALAADERSTDDRSNESKSGKFLWLLGGATILFLALILWLRPWHWRFDKQDVEQPPTAVASDAIEEELPEVQSLQDSEEILLALQDGIDRQATLIATYLASENVQAISVDQNDRDPRTLSETLMANQIFALMSDSLNAREIQVQDDCSFQLAMNVTMLQDRLLFNTKIFNRENSSQQDFSLTRRVGPQQKVADPIAQSLSSDTSGRMLALVVGINDFKFSEQMGLMYSKQDAIEFSKQLRQSGYTTVTTLTSDEASLANIQVAIDQLARSANDNDTLLFFYSGHGFQIDDQRFVMPQDGQVDDPRSLLPITDINDRMASSKAKNKLLMLDACAVGSFERNTRGISVKRSASKPDLSSQLGLSMLLACSEMQVSYEAAELGHGVFTYFIVQAFDGSGDSNRDGKLSLYELGSFVSDRVESYTQSKFSASQTPYFRHDGGDFIVGKLGSSE